jgi:hypothetical protein
VTTDSDVSARPDWRPAALEYFASVVAVLAIGMLFLNWLTAHLTFFGAPVVIQPERVRTYWVTVGVLAVAMVGSLAGAAWRGARKAWVWHLLVCAAGTGAAVVLAVTTAGPVHDEPEPPKPHHTGPLCYSGGDNSGCPGG